MPARHAEVLGVLGEARDQGRLGRGDDQHELGVGIVVRLLGDRGDRGAILGHRHGHGLVLRLVRVGNVLLGDLLDRFDLDVRRRRRAVLELAAELPAAAAAGDHRPVGNDKRELLDLLLPQAHFAFRATIDVLEHLGKLLAEDLAVGAAPQVADADGDEQGGVGLDPGQFRRDGDGGLVEVVGAVALRRSADLPGDDSRQGSQEPGGEPAAAPAQGGTSAGVRGQHDRFLGR